MSASDLIAAGGFLVLFGIGLLVSSLFAPSRARTAKLVRARMHDATRSRAASRPGTAGNPDTTLVRLKHRRSAMQAWLARRVEHIVALAGVKGLYVVGASAALALIAALVCIGTLDPPRWTLPLLCVGLPLAAARASYRSLVARFRARFLEAFPDTIDLLVRAVRAGVPVVQAILAAGHDTKEPVRSVFRTMSDGLTLGADLKRVLDQSAEQLQIADFSFFAACVLLQQEAGGSLGETLEELSQIIRARRDIRVKTRALTAEGRITTKMIAAIPFAVVGLLSVVNRSYILLLFTTQTGHHLLMIAAVLLAIGLAIIHRQSKLETSR